MAIPYNSNYDETMPFSDTCAQVVAQANTEETYTVPGAATNNYTALFSYNDSANVFVCLNATPTIPAAGTVGTQQYNEFKPHKRYVKGGDVIHFISPDATVYCGVSLRSI